jgi:hypothetical protein
MSNKNRPTRLYKDTYTDDLDKIVSLMREAAESCIEFSVSGYNDFDSGCKRYSISFGESVDDAKQKEIALAKIQAEFPNADISEGYWTCYEDGFSPFDDASPKNSKNPLGYCVYDTDDDPACDQCLYCGQPDERK